MKIDETYKVCTMCGERFKEEPIATRTRDRYLCEMQKAYVCGPACLHAYVLREKQEELGW